MITKHLTLGINKKKREEKLDYSKIGSDISGLAHMYTDNMHRWEVGDISVPHNTKFALQFKCC